MGNLDCNGVTIDTLKDRIRLPRSHIISNTRHEGPLLRKEVVRSWSRRIFVSPPSHYRHHQVTVVNRIALYLIRSLGSGLIDHSYRSTLKPTGLWIRFTAPFILPGLSMLLPDGSILQPVLPFCSWRCQTWVKQQNMIWTIATSIMSVASCDDSNSIGEAPSNCSDCQIAI